jgi:hypothetical protein
VEGNVPVDSDALLVTDFVNLKIEPAQSFGGAHRDRLCVRVFIVVSAHTCINICVCIVFLKKMCALVLIMGKICYGRERIKCFGFSEGGKVELGLGGKPEYGLGGKILSPRENTTGLWFSSDPKKQNFRIRLHPEGRFIVESSESVYN